MKLSSKLRNILVTFVVMIVFGSGGIIWLLKSRPQITTSSGEATIFAVRMSPRNPPECSNSWTNCSETKAGHRFLLVQVRGEGQDAPGQVIDFTFNQEDSNKTAKTHHTDTETSKARKLAHVIDGRGRMYFPSQVTMQMPVGAAKRTTIAFVVDEDANDFRLIWPDNQVVPLSRTLFIVGRFAW